MEILEFCLFVFIWLSTGYLLLLSTKLHFKKENTSKFCCVRLVACLIHLEIWSSGLKFHMYADIFIKSEWVMVQPAHWCPVHFENWMYFFSWVLWQYCAHRIVPKKPAACVCVFFFFWRLEKYYELHSFRDTLCWTFPSNLPVFLRTFQVA